MLRQNLGRQLMTVDDLMSKLRQHGISELNEVRHAYMESDGEISIIKQDSGNDDVDASDRKTPM
jgi:uncharacterized membrane protein YcaP (DUF421 family)